jgi:hypothetical protein
MKYFSLKLRRMASWLLAGALFALAVPSAQAIPVYDNLGSQQAGADPVQSYGPLAASFSTGAEGGLLGDVQLLLKSGSDQLVGALQVKLLSDSGFAPGIELGTLGSLLSSDISSSAFSIYNIASLGSFALAANTRYWVELFAVDPVAVEWSWSDDVSTLGVNGNASYSQIFGVLPNSDAGAYQMSVNVSPVPLPGTAVLYGVGLAAMGVVRRYRRKD